MLCERHMIERERKKRNYCVDKQKLESVFYFKKEVFIFLWKFGQDLKKLLPTEILSL